MLQEDESTHDEEEGIEKEDAKKVKKTPQDLIQKLQLEGYKRIIQKHRSKVIKMLELVQGDT